MVLHSDYCSLHFYVSGCLVDYYCSSVLQKKDGELDPNMNPLSKVNHLFPGLVTWTFESSGPPHCPIFNAIANVQGKTFSSSGEINRRNLYLSNRPQQMNSH